MARRIACQLADIDYQTLTRQPLTDELAAILGSRCMSKSLEPLRRLRVLERASLAQENVCLGDCIWQHRCELQRAMKAAHILVVIDYLQMMRGSANYGGNRVQEMSEISRSVKGLARDRNVPGVIQQMANKMVQKKDQPKKDGGGGH